MAKWRRLRPTSAQAAQNSKREIEKITEASTLAIAKVTSLPLMAVDVMAVDVPSDLVSTTRPLPLSELNSVAIIVPVPNASSSPDCPN